LARRQIAALIDVLVSSNMKELVAGTGLVLEDHGLRALKGILDDRNRGAVAGF
jgi:hypothetical protein